MNTLQPLTSTANRGTSTLGRCAAMLCLTFPIWTGCSSGSGSGASPVAGEVDAIPADVPLPANSLTISGASADTFNPLEPTLTFALANSSLDQTPGSFRVVVNNTAVDMTSAVVTSASVSVAVTFIDGKNDVRFEAYDVDSRPLFFANQYWCGANQLTVDVVDENQSPISADTEVQLALSDDPSVTASATTNTGSFTFSNVPSRTVVVEARTASNQAGVGGDLGNAGVVSVVIADFEPPSQIANNDLSQGSAGWEFDPGTVTIVPHTEGLPGAFFGFGSTDNDLMLETVGEGPQTLSRTFVIEPGTTSASLRYRFITSEVPGGYFGTQFNDYFSVSIRSQTAGQIASESNTMNGLGLDAFDFATGATAWRVIVLDTELLDTIQADITVANVGDGALDSQVVVDLVAEQAEPVTPSLAWDPTNGGLQLSWTVEAGPLQQDVPIQVYWATSPAYAGLSGPPLFTYVVPAGTGPSSGAVAIPGTGLAQDPEGVTHVIASTSETNTFALPDVTISFGANANAAVVPDTMLDIVRDGLRAAGQANGAISSTARSPSDQARAMFQNLTNPARTIAENVTNQYELYGANGDQVVAEFEQLAGSQTRAEVLANQTAIRQAMTDLIEELGPANVSKHCADPTEISVIDVGSLQFLVNGALFQASAEPRVDLFLIEPSNNAYHLQLDL